MISHRKFVVLCPLFQTCQEMNSILGNLGLDPDDINNVAVEIKNGKRIPEVCGEIPSRIGMRGYINNNGGLVNGLFEDGEKVQKIWEVRFKSSPKRLVYLFTYF